MIVGGKTVIGYAPWFTAMRTRAPRIVASSASARSTASTSSRACPAASRFSTRSSIRFTGRGIPRAHAGACRPGGEQVLGGVLDPLHGGRDLAGRHTARDLLAAGVRLL